ncbi:hypothetical protein [Serratia liquefaciens]|uniref:hypothetical protein n=1 Tax=Serratia liquefaciens TaxID=614 RepID=UPI0039060EBB
MVTAFYLTMAIIVGVPSFVVVMSFITWENGFKYFGVGYLVRIAMVLVAYVWVLYFLTDAGWTL